MNMHTTSPGCKCSSVLYMHTTSLCRICSSVYEYHPSDAAVYMHTTNLGCICSSVLCIPPVWVNMQQCIRIPPVCVVSDNLVASAEVYVHTISLGSICISVYAYHQSGCMCSSAYAYHQTGFYLQQCIRIPPVRDVNAAVYMHTTSLGWVCSIYMHTTSLGCIFRSVYAYHQSGSYLRLCICIPPVRVLSAAVHVHTTSLGMHTTGLVVCVAVYVHTTSLWCICSIVYAYHQSVLYMQQCI